LRVGSLLSLGDLPDGSLRVLPVILLGDGMPGGVRGGSLMVLFGAVRGSSLVVLSGGVHGVPFLVLSDGGVHRVPFVVVLRILSS